MHIDCIVAAVLRIDILTITIIIIISISIKSNNISITLIHTCQPSA